MDWPDVLGVVVDDIYRRKGADSRPRRLAALRALRRSIVAIMNAYRTPNAAVDYSDESVRDAYMAFYFPAYVMPMYGVLRELHRRNPRHLDILLRQPRVDISAFGCGPGPEVLGTLAFMREHGAEAQSVTAHLFDVNCEGWSRFRDLSFSRLAQLYWPGPLQRKDVNCDFLESCKECGEWCDQELYDSDVILFQNFLNDLPDERDRLEVKATQIAEKARSGAILVFVDVYLRDALNRLETINDVLSEQLCQVLIDRGDREYPQTALDEDLAAHVFTDGLNPKDNVLYRSLVLRRL